MPPNVHVSTPPPPTSRKADHDREYSPLLTTTYQHKLLVPMESAAATYYTSDDGGANYSPPSWGLTKHARRELLEDKKKQRQWTLFLTAGCLALLIVLWHVDNYSAKPSEDDQLVHEGEKDTFAHDKNAISVAFVGNSMFYFNDFPRFFQAMADVPVVQNSCLHGGASIPSLLLEGNGMYPQFETPKAMLPDHQPLTSSTLRFRRIPQPPLHDYGACTVEQLLTGRDARLMDPGYAIPADVNSTNLNPCREDVAYFSYILPQLAASAPPSWDFVMINDNTRNPARAKTRAQSLQFLEAFYLPWFQNMPHPAIPVFLWTHAYQVESTAGRNMTGLDDVANFTSLTGAGVRAYANLLSQHLPPAQQPRIAPVGLAFLMVHEERPDLWSRLFHAADHIHASPSGSFLQGCIVHYTLTGRMPDRRHVLRRDMASLWHTARMMQHAWEPPNPFPDRATAEYLYNVAERIMVHGELPATYIDYQQGEVAHEG